MLEGRVDRDKGERGLIERIHAFRSQLAELDAELGRLEEAYIDAVAQIEDLRWKLAKAEHRSRSGSGDVEDESGTSALQEEVEALRREVELYRYNWQLEHGEIDPARKDHRKGFWRR